MHPLPNVFPQLYTSRLDLVELQPWHATDLLELFSDPLVTQYYHVMPLKTELDAERVISYFYHRYKDQLGIRWGITLQGQSKLIGTIGFNSFPQLHRGVIVYALAHAYWGQGYMTEAILELVRYGFRELELSRIEAEVMPANVSSERVLIKNGFHQEGTLKKWMEWEGRLFDINMWALVRE
ncbi:GNAT family protein [Chitinophaga sp.]|uniref:GNAT family N-acetyltransferase n=1 Tax=Chitinophaga sp. TaxID=1869181 RepID=UPI0031D9E2F6